MPFATLLVVVAALGLLGVSHVTAGPGPVVAHAAVLNTARLSGMVFVLALVAGGFATETAGWRQWLGGQHAALQRAFVGAHFVHFSAVLLLAWLDAAHALHRLEPPMLAGTASGFLRRRRAHPTSVRCDAGGVGRRHGDPDRRRDGRQEAARPRILHLQ